MWAENVQNQTKEKGSKKTLVTDGKSNSKSKESLTKKPDSKKVKEISQIIKKTYDTTKKIPKISKPDTKTSVPVKSKDIDFSKKTQNANVNNQTEITGTSKENPFLNEKPIVNNTRNDEERTYNPFLQKSTILPSQKTFDNIQQDSTLDDTVEAMTEDDESYALENRGDTMYPPGYTNSLLQNRQEPVSQLPMPQEGSGVECQEEESMDIDDAVQFSQTIMKEVIHLKYFYNLKVKFRNNRY